jgi:hypothetical protein
MSRIGREGGEARGNRARQSRTGEETNEDAGRESRQ